MTDQVVELEEESSQILAQMDKLRLQLLQATRSGQRPNLRLLEQMETASVQFRDVNARIYEPS